MIDRAIPLGAHGVEQSAPPSETYSFEAAAQLDFVLDLTIENAQLELDLRPTLTTDASLLVAPGRKRGIKRLADVLGAALALLVLAPLILVTALAVKLTSPGPVLFKQWRAGENGGEFCFYKFRSMRLNAESDRDELNHLDETDGPVFKIRADPRITGIGRFIRRSSIDELPQLWNVIRGEMSLVGPRPLPAEEAAACSEWEAQRLAVKPGITCIWQVSGRSELDFETWVTMDIEYIESWSLWLDLKLLAKTIPAVLFGRGAY